MPRGPKTEEELVDQWCDRVEKRTRRAQKIRSQVFDASQFELGLSSRRLVDCPDENARLAGLGYTAFEGEDY